MHAKQESLQLPLTFRSKTDLRRANRTLESREACPSDQDLWIPNADQILPILAKKGLSIRRELAFTT
jgi:hypothetical protein